MSKDLKVNKLYTGLNDGEIAERSKKTLICSIATVVAAVVLAIIPQNGLKVLFGVYGWIGPITVFAWIVLIIFAVYCLVGHFTFYRIRKELYENDLPALRGEWHTFAAIEIQMLMNALFALGELYLVVRYFDIGTLICVFVALGGTFASVVVRTVTDKSFKNLSSVPPVTEKTVEVSEDAEEFFDGNEEE